MEEKELISNVDEVLIDQICAALKEHNIAYMKKSDGAGSYLGLTYGYSNEQKRIFVNSEDYDKAQEIIKSIYSEEGDTENLENEIPEELREIENEENENEENVKKYKTMAKIPVYLAFGLLLFAVVSILIAFISNN